MNLATYLGFIVSVIVAVADAVVVVVVVVSVVVRVASGTVGGVPKREGAYRAHAGRPVSPSMPPSFPSRSGPPLALFSFELGRSLERSLRPGPARRPRAMARWRTRQRETVDK